MVENYDVIIIGAGISGLVCGCYLAREGLKVLIVEKNANPGGYCSSFKRQGFFFDACAHSLGSLREKGNIYKVLTELNINEELKIDRYDPCDTIITPDGKIYFWSDVNKTIQGLQDRFPQEAKNIKLFFQYIIECEGLALSSLRDITFDVVIDKYFVNKHLKEIISLLVLGNIGLPASKVLALTAVMVYKEFILDGGYYLREGMQKFPDTLAKKFKNLGGELLLRKLVKEINLDINGSIKGVTVDSLGFVQAKYIVSNVDPMQTFLRLIVDDKVNKYFSEKLSNMEASLSTFILYLGLKDDYMSLPEVYANIWYLPYYDIEKIYSYILRGMLDNLDYFLLRILPNRKSIQMFINAPFMNAQYWQENKNKWLDAFIKKGERVIPDLSNNIVFKDAASPYTLCKWTLNYKGAAYGWMSTPSQFAVSGLSQITTINRLYLTGHWASLVQGIPGVAYLGRDTAKIILKKEKKWPTKGLL